MRIVVSFAKHHHENFTIYSQCWRDDSESSILDLENVRSRKEQAIERVEQDKRSERERERESAKE